MARRRMGRIALLALVAAISAGFSGATGARVAAAAPLAATQESPVEELLRRVQEKYRALRTLRAQFEQLQEVRVGMAPRIATGTWQMLAPARMRVDYDETRRVFVADGEKIYWYLPDDSQVHVRPQDALAQRGNALLYLSGQGDLQEDFAVSGTEWRTKLDPRNVQLRLDPLVEDTNYSYLMLEVEPDSAIIARLVSFGLFGEATEFRFTAIEVDIDLAAELFRFTIPPGVQVETLGN